VVPLRASKLALFERHPDAYGGGVFEVFCPTHGGRVMLGARSVLAFAQAADGVVVRWRCRCGDVGVQRFDHHVGARITASATV
jgi:hypothetical protein